MNNRFGKNHVSPCKNFRQHFNYTVSKGARLTVYANEVLTNSKRRLNVLNKRFFFFFFVFFVFFFFFSAYLKDGRPYLFHSFRNKYFNKISLGNMLYFENKL